MIDNPNLIHIAYQEEDNIEEDEDTWLVTME